jgi:hypothetical protein
MFGWLNKIWNFVCCASPAQAPQYEINLVGKEAVELTKLAVEGVSSLMIEPLIQNEISNLLQESIPVLIPDTLLWHISDIVIWNADLLEKWEIAKWWEQIGATVDTHYVWIEPRARNKMQLFVTILPTEILIESLNWQQLIDENKILPPRRIMYPLNPHKGIGWIVDISTAADSICNLDALYEKNFLKNYTKTRLWLKEINYDTNISGYYKHYKWELTQLPIKSAPVKINEPIKVPAFEWPSL